MYRWRQIMEKRALLSKQINRKRHDYLVITEIAIFMLVAILVTTIVAFVYLQNLQKSILEDSEVYIHLLNPHRIFMYAFIILFIVVIMLLVASNFFLMKMKQFFQEGIENSDLLIELREAHVLRYFVNNVDDEEVPECLKINEHQQCIIILCSTKEVCKTIRQLAENMSSFMLRKMPKCEIQILANERKDYFALFMKEPRSVNRFIDRAFIENIIKEKAGELEAAQNIVLFSSVSEVFKKESGYKIWFYKQYTFSKYNLLNRCKTIMEEKDFENSIDEEIPKKNYSEVLAKVREENTEAAMELLKQFIDSIKDYEIKRVGFILSSLCAEVNQITSEFSLTSKQYQEMCIRHYIKMVEQSTYQQLLDYIHVNIEYTCSELMGIQDKTTRLKVLDSIAYIQDNYANRDISVEQVADIYNISVSYYSKLFNESLGKTFPEVINELRLENARKILLEDTIITIKEVAADNGFSSVSYFSSQFKKKYGISPTTYRSKI